MTWRQQLLLVGCTFDKNTRYKCQNHPSGSYVAVSDNGCEYEAQLTHELLGVMIIKKSVRIYTKNRLGFKAKWDEQHRVSPSPTNWRAS